ncbi:methyltransferase [Cardiosporidium cionae]|uniref:carnosine N-methyltransferase n=1 Tax=Cardiosporidium cionae TaxID=476202 RepID=A0ABQ7J5U8_9APIC|nr:methyltransferase [Cardiosporidium cionae]|eukprot:KAF8819358.1 methyltransferase [Cardiosporidium cionae]
MNGRSLDTAVPLAKHEDDRLNYQQNDSTAVPMASSYSNHHPCHCFYADEEAYDPSQERDVEDEEEKQHFANICFAFSYYEEDSLRDVARMEQNFQKLPIEDKRLLIEPVESRIQNLKEAIGANQNFIDILLSPQYGENFSDLLSPTPSTLEDFVQNHSRDEVFPEDEKRDAPTEDGLLKERRESQDIPDRGEKFDFDHTCTNTIPSQPPSPFFNTSHNPPLSRVRDAMKILPDPVVLERNMTKVRATLRQFVREWSEEGAKERMEAYTPLLMDLDAFLPIKNPLEPPRVLCPGCGLGRLPFEVVRKGYGCQGNEFSYFMLLGSNLILNYAIKPKACLIYPFCLSTSNRKQHNDNLTPILIPDVNPSDHVTADYDFSMSAGEFIEVYGNQKAKWDGILTCFFIDTAKNILQYIRTIALILRPGGLWANLGPLLYHYAEMANEMSVELSWEEVKGAIEKWFRFEKIEWKDTFYTSNSDSMMQILYHTVHFVAIRTEAEL